MYLKKKNVTKNPDIVKNKIETADIIYIGGGDTIKLMDTVKEYEIDKLLDAAVKRDCVIAGVSAGAILLANSGFSDSFILREESDKYEFVDGLKFVEYGLENCTALKIVNKDIKVIKSKSDANAYLCKYNKEFIEDVI